MRLYIKVSLLIICMMAMVTVSAVSTSHSRELLPVIEHISIYLEQAEPEIRIASNVTVEYLDYTLEKPSRIIIDPLGTVYTNLDERVFSGVNLVQSVSIVKARGQAPAELGKSYYPLDFIVIELKKPVHYDILREEKIVVKLGSEVLPPRKVSYEAVELPGLTISQVVPAVGIGEEFFDEEKFPLAERYRIERGDEVEISVWQHPDLLRRITVRPDGYISFPLAGDVKAEGMTAEMLAQQVSLRLSRLLRKPEVSIIVTGSASKGIYILGAVSKPGLYPYETKMTTLRAVSLAGSWNTYAQLKSVLVVKRLFSDNAEVIRVNLWDVINKGEVRNDLALQAGDIVYVPKNFIGNLNEFLNALRIGFGTGFTYSLND